MAVPTANGICAIHNDVTAVGDERLFPDRYWKRYRAVKRERAKAAKKAAEQDAFLHKRGGL